MVLSKLAGLARGEGRIHVVNNRTKISDADDAGAAAQQCIHASNRTGVASRATSTRNDAIAAIALLAFIATSPIGSPPVRRRLIGTLVPSRVNLHFLNRFSVGESGARGAALKLTGGL